MASAPACPGSLVGVSGKEHAAKLLPVMQKNQVLSGDTALKAADAACKGRIASVRVA